MKKKKIWSDICSGCLDALQVCCDDTLGFKVKQISSQREKGKLVIPIFILKNIKMVLNHKIFSEMQKLSWEMDGYLNGGRLDYPSVALWFDSSLWLGHWVFYQQGWLNGEVLACFLKVSGSIPHQETFFGGLS